MGCAAIHGCQTLYTPRLAKNERGHEIEDICRQWRHDYVILTARDVYLQVVESRGGILPLFMPAFPDPAGCWLVVVSHVFTKTD